MKKTKGALLTLCLTLSVFFFFNKLYFVSHKFTLVTFNCSVWLLNKRSYSRQFHCFPEYVLLQYVSQTMT